MLCVVFVVEETRVPCVKAGLISTILSHLESEDPNVVLQALRAIGNISYDNGRYTQNWTLIIKIYYRWQI